MSPGHLSPIQLCNYLILNLLRDQAQASPIDACATFGITKSQLEGFRAQLSPEKVLATVANVGESLLFVPRGDLGHILSSPSPLLGALVASRTSDRTPVLHQASH